MGKILKIFKNWLIPAVLAILLFFAIRPVLAQNTSLPTNITVGKEINSGFSRIFYFDGQNKAFISKEGLNSQDQEMKGKFIVWSTEINGQGQIFLYNLESSTTIQLTSTGTNLRPKVDETGRVVWESWIENSWQLFLYDGLKIAQLTEGDMSINPFFEKDYMVFARQDVTGQWRSVLYSFSTQEFKDVSFGPENEHPTLQDGKIVYKYPSIDGQKEFPLTVEDLEILNIASQPSPTDIPLGAIIEELNLPTPLSTPEASLAPSASPEASLSPQEEAGQTPPTSEPTNLPQTNE